MQKRCNLCTEVVALGSRRRVRSGGRGVSAEGAGAAAGSRAPAEAPAPAQPSATAVVPALSVVVSRAEPAAAAVPGESAAEAGPRGPDAVDDVIQPLLEGRLDRVLLGLRISVASITFFSAASIALTSPSADLP